MAITNLRVRADNYWAILALDIFGMIFWIASFALLASQVANFMDEGTDCTYDYYYGTTCTSYELTETGVIVGGCLCAAAGIGGLEL